MFQKCFINIFECFNDKFNNKIKNKTLLITMKLACFEFCTYSIKNDKRNEIIVEFS